MFDFNSPIKIGLDGRSFQGKRTGVGRVIFEYCRELDSLFPNATFYIYSHIPLEMPVHSPRWILKLDPFFLSKYLKAALWLKLRGKSLCKKDNLDLFWGTCVFLPPLPKSVKSMITVFDINYKIVPETMGSTHFVANKLFFKRDVSKASSVLSISQGTSDKLLQFFGRGADAVARPSVSKAFSSSSPEEIKNCHEKYHLDNPYFLAVATWEPRKNLELLIHSFLSLKKEGGLPDHKLVLVGGEGWKSAKLQHLVNNDQKKDIVALGYVPDQDLPALYSGTTAFVFPSIYEGFGIPVLEARVCGATVIASDIPELHEAAGPQAFYIKPDEDHLKKMLLKVAQERPTFPPYIADIDYTTWKTASKIIADLILDTLNRVK